MIDYPDSLREIAIKLSEAIEERLASHSLRLGKLEENDKNRKKLLKRFLEMTDNLKADKDRIKKIDAFLEATKGPYNKERDKKIDELLEATKGPEIKAFCYCDDPNSPWPGREIKRGPETERIDEFMKQEVNFVDESIAEEQIELHGTRNIFEGRDDLVEEFNDDPICFRCNSRCDGCACKIDCPLQEANHAEVDGSGLRSSCASCNSNKRCYS